VSEDEFFASAVPERPYKPPKIDTSVAHIARVYDYWLGGKDNFEVDRIAGQEAIDTFPAVVSSVRANRAFLSRTVRYLTRELGIRQFLDIGTGIPTANNTHEVAQSVVPESRVVYADNDPMVLAHARALLLGSAQGMTAYLDADLQDTEKILYEAAETLDFTQPIAVMLVAVLHMITDEDDPAGIVTRLMDAVPAGSTLTISHVPNDMHTGAMAQVSERLNRLLSHRTTYRSKEQVTAYFDGLELVPPGVVPIQQWRPDTEEEANATAVMWGGVGRKTGS